MGTLRVILLILGFGGLFAGLVYLIHRLTRGRLFPKYIPGLLFLTGALVYVGRARWFSEGMQGLAFVVLAMMLLGIGLISLVTAILIDLNRKISSL